MKNLIILLAIMLGCLSSMAQGGQSLGLEACYAKAKAHSPLSQQPALLSQAAQLQVERIGIERRPQLSWNALASLQTETVSFPFTLPIPDGNLDLPLYRFQTTADLQYAIYDGGMTAARQGAERAKLAASQQEIAVELDKLKAQVNQYVFGILLLREKIGIQRQAQQTLEDKVKVLEAAVRHGVALEGDADQLRVEVLRRQSEIEQAEGDIRGLLAGLSALIGEALAPDVQFELPPLDALRQGTPLLRPELQLFAYQQESILAREGLIAAAWRPKVSAFAQAGLGAPNPLNFFDESLSPFAIGGLRFSWNFIDWKQASRDRQLLSLSSQLIGNQRAAFEAAISQQDGRYREQAAALEALLERDEEIARLQERILRQVSAQLDQGTATAAEYTAQANALQLALLNRKLHELQLVQAWVELWNLRGGIAGGNDK
jgi:outer membrane protein TolC